MKGGNQILSGYGTTIFEVMSRLAVEHQAINLGQGFPEGLEPMPVIEAAVEALQSGGHQYPPMMGLPELRAAVAEHNLRFYGLDIDPATEVMVTSGATEALADCLFGLIEPGDEVVVIEPLYDSYLPIIRRAGGIAKLVRLEPPHWDLPRQALEAAFSSKTKLIVLNSPMNPIGKVFSEDELAFIAQLVERFDAYAVCDEVYEHLVFDGVRHRPLMTFPGMDRRCVRIGSAGKTFSVTGWKVGYVTARAELLTPVAKAHQYITFTTPPGLQAAVAAGLKMGDDYFNGLARDMADRRDRLAAGLAEVGFSVLPAPGTYFLVADIRPLGVNEPGDAFCRRMTAEAKVAAVPLSAFHTQEGAADHYIRFCFAKKAESLDEAVRRLKASYGHGNR